MRSIKTGIWICVVSGLTIIPAYASESANAYDYFEIFTSDTETKGVDGNRSSTGSGIAMNLEFGDSNFFSGAIGKSGGESALALGVGMYNPLSDSTDFVGEIGLVNSKHDSGFAAAVGFRSRLGQVVEINGGFSGSSVGSALGLDLAMRLHFSESVSLEGWVSHGFASSENDDDSSGTGIAVQIYF